MSASQADVENQIKDLAKALANRINELHGVTHKIDKKQHFFYSGKPIRKNLFASFLLTKDALIVRLKTDPVMVFNDPKHWTPAQDIGFKNYPLFLLGKLGERKFKVQREEQIGYAMELIIQAYMQIRKITRPVLDGYEKTRGVLHYGWKKGVPPGVTPKFG